MSEPSTVAGPSPPRSPDRSPSPPLSLSEQIALHRLQAEYERRQRSFARLRRRIVAACEAERDWLELRRPLRPWQLEYLTDRGYIVVRDRLCFTLRAANRYSRELGIPEQKLPGNI